MPKFRRATPPNSEVISANLLPFKPIFDPPLKKVVRGHLGDFVRTKKNIMRKTEVLPKTIVFRRTNKPQQNLSPLPQAIAYGRTKKLFSLYTV